MKKFILFSFIVLICCNLVSCTVSETSYTISGTIIKKEYIPEKTHWTYGYGKSLSGKYKICNHRETIPEKYNVLVQYYLPDNGCTTKWLNSKELYDSSDKTITLVFTKRTYKCIGSEEQTIVYDYKNFLKK